MRKHNRKNDKNDQYEAQRDGHTDFDGKQSESSDFGNLADSICTLLNSARAGSDNSHAELMAQLTEYMRIVANSRVNEEFQAKFGESDIVQQSIAVAIEKFDDFKGGSAGELYAWVLEIFKNELRQNQRALRSQKRDLYRERAIEPANNSVATGIPIFDPQLTPASDAVRRENQKRVEQAMQMLSADHQQIIRLRNWDRLSFAEIGRQMKRTENAVTKLWYRALIQLRKNLEVCNDD